MCFVAVVAIAVVVLLFFCVAYSVPEYKRLLLLLLLLHQSILQLEAFENFRTQSQICW